jgi:hypothetical protein
MLAGGKVVMVEHLRSFIQFHATTTFENTLPFVLGFSIIAFVLVEVANNFDCRGGFGHLEHCKWILG